VLVPTLEPLSEIFASLVVAGVGVIALLLRLIFKRLKAVLAEQKPNGGSSMRDSIESIKTQVGEISSQLGRLDAQMRGRFELENGGYYLMAESGRCLWVSSVWSELTGVPPGEARGDGWLRGVHPEDRERVWAAWEMAIRTRERFQMRYRTAKGIEVTGRAVELNDSNDNVVGVLGTISPEIVED
jgi:PAS domain-containing protein